jgi:hypothetical protein
MPDRLDNLKDVEPDSSTGHEDNHDSGLGASPDPGSGPGDKTGEGKGDQDKSGRTVDNVRGELNRKLEQQREYFTGVVSSLEQKIERLVEARGGGEPEKPKSANSLDDLSVADLRNLRPQVPEEQRETFEAYLREREIKEEVQSQVQQYQSQQSFQQQEADANKQAVSRWPDLKDKSSTLYGKTNEILQRMGKAADENPRAVLDAANEAGIELGLSPRSFHQPKVTGARHTAPGGSAPPPGEQPNVDQSRLDEIAKGLGDAFKGGKISDEAMERIRENTALYRQNVDKLLK